MNEKGIKELAIKEGFLFAEITDTENFVFDFSFRRYCEEDLCGLFGKNFSCPPSCGEPEELKQRVLKHKKALVLCTQWEISDLNESEKLNRARNFHNAAMIRLIKKLKASGRDGFMIGSGACTLCKPCKAVITNICPHPEMRYSCMSAYCINVKRLAEDCKMDYDYKNGILPFFGVYVFD